MIEKIEMPEMDETYQSAMFAKILGNKINHLVDAVNAIQKEREAERFEIQEWIGILEDVRKSVNIHEKQIDELQMKVEPEKCEIPADNSGKANCQENVQPDAETRSENVQDEMPRCPFCGEELYYAQEIDGGFEILSCNCPHGIWLFGNDKMWYNLEKATTELDRTRKALDVAVDALKYANKCIKGGCVSWETEIDKALEQINGKTKG